MADIQGVGLTNFGAANDAERQQRIEKIKEMQEQQERQATRNSMQQSQGGSGGSAAGSFMSSFSGAVDPKTLSSMFGGGSSAGGGAASGAGGASSGGFSLSSMFGGGGGAAAGGGGAAAGGSAAGGGASAAGGSAASGLSSMGPWAALAAVILANESNARDNDYRSKDDKQYAQDLLGGAVLEQDLNQRWLPKIYGKDLKNDKLGLGHDQKAVGEFGSGDFSNGFKALEDGTLGKSLKAIKKLF